MTDQWQEQKEAMIAGLLALALTMGNGIADNTIEQHPRGGGGE
jgi:hypothetical protein